MRTGQKKRLLKLICDFLTASTRNITGNYLYLFISLYSALFRSKRPEAVRTPINRYQNAFFFMNTNAAPTARTAIIAIIAMEASPV